MARLKRLGMVAIPRAAGLAALARITSDHTRRSQASEGIALADARSCDDFMMQPSDIR